MNTRFSLVMLIAALSAIAAFASVAHADPGARCFNGKYEDYRLSAGYYDKHGRKKQDDSVQLGARRPYLAEGMDEGKLKDRLKQCENGPFYVSDFPIGHRGAALQFPEHTKKSYETAARMGAGIIERDVTFTKDGELVCRHAVCDLRTTTNIVATPLNSQCAVPWSGPGSSPKCCTSDLTRSEFKSLTGTMDASNPG